MGNPGFYKLSRDVHIHSHPALIILCRIRGTRIRFLVRVPGTSWQQGKGTSLHVPRTPRDLEKLIRIYGLVDPHSQMPMGP